VVNQLSDRLETSETTPERQLILDSHIRARIRDELEHLKKDEEDVRGEIERALEKENLDREKSMASDGDGTSSSILLGDMDEIRVRIEKYHSRRKDVGVEADGDAVIECYK
jgi:altered-inheritance-of-mitochondria protein 13